MMYTEKKNVLTFQVLKIPYPYEIVIYWQHMSRLKFLSVIIMDTNIPNLMADICFLTLALMMKANYCFHVVDYLGSSDQ